MLDRVSFKILKVLNRNYRKTTPKLVAIDRIATESNLGVDVCVRCLDFLIVQGYVREIKNPDSKICLGYEPTHMGCHYIEFQVLNLLFHLLSDIALPILVTILTLLATGALNLSR